MSYQAIETGIRGKHREIKIPSILRMVVLGIIVITPAITPGMSIGFPAVALPQLNLSLSEMSWFASIASIATPLGNLVTGWIIDKYGRRPALIISILPSILGWSVLAFDADLATLYTGRVLTGFALGAASLPSSVYAAECITINDGHLHLRGSLTTWTTLALSAGTLLVYSLGSLLHYNYVAMVAAIISAMSLVLILLFIPESPTWLHRRGRIGDAEWSQKRLGISQPILLNSEVCPTSITKSEAHFSLTELVKYLNKIKRPDVYIPLVLTVSFLFFLQFSGIYVLTTYMINVITSGSRKIFLSPYLVAVLAGAVQFLATTLITFIIPYSGIKKLSLTSCAGVSVGMLLLALSTTYLDFLQDRCIFFIHLTAILMTVFMAGLGFTAIPFAILGEVFPSDAKSFASISLMASSMFNFLVLKLHPYLEAYLAGSVYYGYAAVSFFGAIFICSCMPETVGKSLEEIKGEFLTRSTSSQSSLSRQKC